MNLNKAHCPLCGNKLVLIPTDVSLLPNRVKKDTCNNQYYIISRKRLRSYTSVPQTSYEYPDSWAAITDGGFLPKDYCYINQKLFTKRQIPGIASIYNTQKKLNKGLLFCWEMVFHCSSCKQKLALNYNPFNIWSSISIIFAITSAFFVTLFVLGLIPNIYNNSQIFFWILLLLAIIFPIFILYSLFGYVYVKLFTSNFVPTNEVDNLIEPCINIKALKKGCNFLFMHKSNVFETKIDNNIFHIYLVNNDKCFDFHICEKNSDYKSIIMLLSNKMNNNEKILIPLSFEGIHIGNAEIVEIFDCAEYESASSVSKPQAKSRQNWRCDECGFTNSGTSSECKSCGKWKN